MTTKPIRALASAIALLFAFHAFAAAPPPPPPIQIHRLNGAITLDGDLSDPGWRDAAKIDRFYETSPSDNTPPTVNTTAWLTYDDHYFYIGIRCDDPHADRIRAPFVERDNVIGTDDNIAVFLDTRNDKRAALELRVNPRGIQGDGFFNDAGGTEDFSPDYFYDTAAKIDSKGWGAEYRIPFSSLRYSDAEQQTWNIMIWRNYPREFRYAYQSVPIPRESNCYMCHLQPIVGLEHLPKAGHLVAAPYVTAQQVSRPEAGPGTPLESGDTKFDGGADVKWTPTANQALDLTINPDFSQVESDVAQITVNQRFAVFFPEKRPFFLEGFDLFDTPMQVAYTRTITDPDWGVRSTGKVAGSNYTVLVTGDKGGGLTILPGPLGNGFALQDSKSIDTIARIRHPLGASAVGGVLTDREIRGGGHNRVFGPDFQWRPNQSDAVTGEVLLSDTTDAIGNSKANSHAIYAGWNHGQQNYDWFGEIRDVGDRFRADLGFIPQNGYRELDGGFGIRRFPNNGFIRFARPYVNFDYQRELGGRTIFRGFNPGILLQGRKNLTVQLNYRPKEQFLVTSPDAPDGKLLDQSYGLFFVQFDPSRRFPRITLNGRLGQFIDYANARVGTGGNVGIAATLRPHDRATFDLTTNREWLNAQGGRVYTAWVERLKTTYSFSAKSLVRVIGQYVKTDSDPSRYLFQDVSPHNGAFTGSVLYSYKVNWQTVLFVGYGDDRLITPTDDLVRADRSFFFKVSYAILR